MSETKKHSGSFYRKRKLQRAAEVKKQATSMKKFICSGSHIPHSSTNTLELLSNSPQEDIVSTSQSFNTGVELEEKQIIDEENESHSDDENQENIIETIEIPVEMPIHQDEWLVPHDPGLWPIRITANIRQILVQRGPEKVSNIEFPVNENGRRFTVNNYYRRRIPNGEDIPRAWLIYSVSKDVVFCFCCRLFGIVRSPLTTDLGYSDWKHLSELLSEHEKSPEHMKAFQSWTEFSKRLGLDKTIDAENQRIIRNGVERWKEVLKRLVLMIEFLGLQNLALRGGSDKLYTKNNGNFLKLVEYVGKFDPVIAEHLRKATSKESYVHYLGKNIQSEIIEILHLKIKEHILNDVNKWTYYSIILDCTPDVSHTEQMSVVIRYVCCQPEKEPSIKEHLLGFIPVECSTGEALTETLLSQLEELKLPLANMRGQGYDNGANMRGKHAGVQNRILSLNPRAFFVPCCAHSLNLVVNDAVSSCSEAVSMFSILQEVYNFFSGSTYRWSVLKKHVSSLTLKPLSETRWESRIDAVNPFRYQAGEIYDALLEISEDSRTDAYGKNAALGLARKMKNYKFICCLILWHQILFRINVISKQLQKEKINISTACQMIEKVDSHFREMRTDNGFEEILVEVRELAENLEVEPNFLNESVIRRRKIKRHFDYESNDEAISDPKKAFRSTVYFYVLDCAINSLKERFSQLKNYSNIFGFMYNDIRCEDKNELLKNCSDLQLALTDGDHSDIDGYQLYQELLVLRSLLPEPSEERGHQPREMLSYITINLSDNFPNVYVALKIALTLPVSVASAERTFSKLKLIKNYLRSTISQDRLVGLVMMFIEHDVLQEIELEEFIKDFSDKKVRKVFCR